MRESLKGESMRTLDFNLLARQLDGVAGHAAAAAEDDVRPAAATLPVLDDEVVGPGFTPDEAARIGLVDESAVDWNGKVDIDLSAEPKATASPTPTSTSTACRRPSRSSPRRARRWPTTCRSASPTACTSTSQWHKVRLSHISPGRTFFVFTRGSKHQHDDLDDRSACCTACARPAACAPSRTPT